MWLVKTSLLAKYLTKNVAYVYIIKWLFNIYIYFGIQCFLPMMLPKWPAVEVFPRDLICCWSNSIVAVKYHCIKAKNCHSEAEEGLSIQAFGPFLVGHSDKQHINEQWSKLIGWWMPGFMTQSASVQK